MKIGVPKEIKRQEYRVAVTPDGVGELRSRGHEVYMEQGAGSGCSIGDTLYEQCGAVILDSHEEVFARADMIYKVKEPLPEEYGLLRQDQILFCFLHLAADPGLTEVLLEKGVSAIAFETIQLEDGHLPLLVPMSEIAGRLSVQEGAKYLEKGFGGRGILLGGIPGLPRGSVVIIGGGTVGMNAATIAVGMGARVTIMDIDKTRLQFLDNLFGPCVDTLYATTGNIRRCIETADLVIGAVLIPGATAPTIVQRQDLKSMREGAVIVDVSVDQGGCVETSHPTYHDDPVFLVDGIAHYCVANMPGVVPITSTWGLANATLPYALKIAGLGMEGSMRDSSIARGINVHQGHITHPALAESLGRPCRKIP